MSKHWSYQKIYIKGEDNKEWHHVIRIFSSCVTHQIRLTSIILIPWVIANLLNIMGYIQVQMMKNMICITIFLCTYHMAFQIKYKYNFKQAHERTTSFSSMEKQYLGVKIPMHDMFMTTTNINKTPHHGTNIVSNKWEFFFSSNGGMKLHRSSFGIKENYYDVIYVNYWY